MSFKLKAPYPVDWTSVYRLGDDGGEGINGVTTQSGNVVLNKKSTFLELDFQINGEVEIVCDRCLDEYNQPIDYEGKLFVKFSETDGDLADDVICLSSTDHELDISHYIFESINLSIPIKRVHPDDEDGNVTCNPEMLEKLENYKTDKPADDGIDPRWDDLKNLMANNN